MRYFLLLTLLAIPTFISLLRPGFFPMYDDMQVIRLQQMDKCVKDGQIPCRWVPDLGYGYGYPLYLYYAPLPYYSMEVVHLLGVSFIDSIKAGFIASILLSGYFFFFFLKKFLNSIASLFGALLYIYTPFRASDLYVRGAMGELWGFFALPFVLWGFENLLDKKNKKAVGFFAISLAVYLTTHNLTVVMTLPLVLLWVLFRLFSKKLEFQLIKKVIISSLVGVGASSFFWLPLFFERNLVYLETLTQGYVNYLAHFIDLKQIFILTKWGYGPSVLGPSDNVFLGVGPIATIGAVLGIVAGLKVKAVKIKIISIIFASFFVLAAFLSHGKSSIVWSNLKFLEFLQFPWRFMLVCSFAASVLGAIFVSSLKRKLAWLMVFVFLIANFAVYNNFYKPKDWFKLNDNQKLSGELLERQQTASIYDYLPKSASKAPGSKAPDSLTIQSGDIRVLNYTRGTDWFKSEVQVGKSGANIVFPAFDFDFWKVYINDQLVEHQKVGELGLVGVKLSSGTSKLNVQLHKTLPRKLGDTLSLVSFLAIFYFLFYETIYKKAK